MTITYMDQQRVLSLIYMYLTEITNYTAKSFLVSFYSSIKDCNPYNCDKDIIDTKLDGVTTLNIANFNIETIKGTIIKENEILKLSETINNVFFFYFNKNLFLGNFPSLQLVIKTITEIYDKHLDEQIFLFFNDLALKTLIYIAEENLDYIKQKSILFYEKKSKDIFMKQQILSISEFFRLFKKFNDSLQNHACYKIDTTIDNSIVLKRYLNILNHLLLPYCKIDENKIKDLKDLMNFTKYLSQYLDKIPNTYLTESIYMIAKKLSHFLKEPDKILTYTNLLLDKNSTDISKHKLTMLRLDETIQELERGE